MCAPTLIRMNRNPKLVRLGAAGGGIYNLRGGNYIDYTTEYIDRGICFFLSPPIPIILS